MKYTLIEMVQSILSDMDSEPVHSISDTEEAMQVASIVRDTFYNLVTTRVIPETEELIKLTASSDSEFPTHFRYADDVKDIKGVWYENEEGYYHEVQWLDPLDFLTRTDERSGDYYTIVKDKKAGTNLRIRTDYRPEYYTSFDDEFLVFNAYDSDVEDTLQEHKVRAYGKRVPKFLMANDYIPDVDFDIFPLLLAEAKSVSMSVLKGGTDPKIEQAARRQRVYTLNERYKTERAPTRKKYGRK